MLSRLIHLGAACLIILTLSLMTAAPFASAADITLGADCTLNDAIRSANSNTPSGDCEAGEPEKDVIRVEATFEHEETGLSILDDLEIQGQGPDAVLDAQGNFLFSVNRDVSVVIRDLEITNLFGGFPTGAILVEGNGRLFFRNSHITNCSGPSVIRSTPQGTVEFDGDSSYCAAVDGAQPEARAPRRAGQTKRAYTARRPVAYTCETLPPTIVVKAAAGTRSGIQCQALDGAGVGIQAIVDMGVIAAVDVWGYVAPGVEVCLRGRGQLFFLDAAFAPRQLTAVHSYPQGDMTCASFNRAGSLVLVPSPAA